MSNKLNISQEEYCFDIAFDDEGASLLINSNEQMFTEKLRSLLKFGTISTRFKDIFDMYYLCKHIDKERFSVCLETYIFTDDGMRENDMQAIIKRVHRVFDDKNYKAKLSTSDKNWIDKDVQEVFDGIMGFLETMGKKKIIIPEMEISINNKCNLKCKECVFFIPHQINPTLSDDILEEHFKCLKILKNNDVEINSLAILGGEPTLTPQRLEESAIMFSSLDNIKQIEIVSNGLNPKGLTENTLKHIQKLSISVYTDDKKFIDAWKKFIDKNASNVNIAFRIQKEWDINSGNIEVPDEKAQKLFESCWYKKHCATIERQRLFVCSLSAKAGKDCDGLLLTENTIKNEIEQYLYRTNFISHCKNCIAEMHLGKIQGGIQQDGVNLQKLIDNATNYLNSID